MSVDGSLRLAELVATVSLATDLAHDVPAESALRDALLAVRLARLAGWSQADVSDAYYLALLYHVGCTGAVAIQSRGAAGDDVAARHWFAEADFADRAQLMRITVTKVGRGWGPAEWGRAVTGMVTGESPMDAFPNIADVAIRLSQRLGASPRVCAALRHTYARWDGKVFPDVPSGDQLTPLARLVHLVHVAQRFSQAGGREAADAVVLQRRGGELDPEFADLWLANSSELFVGLHESSVWDEVLEAEPQPFRTVPPRHLDEVTTALADFVDLKSPYTHGHSDRVARLAEDAGRAAGLGQDSIEALRRAGHVHDIGNVSIPDRVWTKRGPLNPSEWARVRLHAYHTERILDVAGPLRAAAQLAALHHERLDGTGYHRGLGAAAQPATARLLGAAEVYQSLLEERAWRPAFTKEEAATELRRMAGEGQLDVRAVDSVLLAAGDPSRVRRRSRTWPAGLTDREVDVLRLLARGLSNAQVGRTLHVSPATVHTHVINIYGKAGVRTRAGATLFALENDLVGAPDEFQPNG